MTDDIQSAERLGEITSKLRKEVGTVIVGQDDELSRQLIKRLPASAVVSQLPAAGAAADLLKLAPALEGKVAIGGQATAYVCEFGTCQAPTQDGAEMMRQVMKGWDK